MVLICEFNPKLVRYYKVVDFMKNSVNTYSDRKSFAGGNGIEIAIFCNKLGYSPKILTFLGGTNGNFISEYLKNSDIDFNYVKIKDNNVENVIIKSRTLQTVVKSNNPKITTEDIQNFYNKFNFELETKNFVCIVSDDEDFNENRIYEDFINFSKQNRVRIAIAVNKIKEIGESIPYMIVLDKDSLEDYSKLRIKTQSEALKASNILLNKGIKIIVLNSSNSTAIITSDISYRIDFNEISSSSIKLNNKHFLSGVAYSVERDYDFETMIKFSMACGLENNFSKFTEVDMGNIKSLMQKVVLNKIGGKNEEL